MANWPSTISWTWPMHGKEGNWGTATDTVSTIPQRLRQYAQSVRRAGAE
eukprot:jgi/Botrbrau1/15155/Bobra.0149s0023.1